MEWKRGVRGLGLLAAWLAGAAGLWAEEEPQVFELEAFVVYGGTVDVVDGFTGEPFSKENEVVEQFRESFNKLLLNYHRWLLRREATFMKNQIESNEATMAELTALAESFGVKDIPFNEANNLVIERAIFNRLVKDPFFKIDALVVWELDRLRGHEADKPASPYARDIRYNAELGKWERRVTTDWHVAIRMGAFDAIKVLKQQGLNLDTNRGYHFIDRPLTAKVKPDSFKDVRLTYPIIVDPREPTEAQVKRLQEIFVSNLASIYDPFSWASRRNMRFRGGFQGPLLRAVEATRFRFSDRKWFDPVLATFLNDVVTIKRQGIAEIYDHSLLRRIPVNGNLLGGGLDLLNWNPGENRSVNYDPTTQGTIGMNFNHPDGARFIILEAYMRDPARFLDALRDTLSDKRKGGSGMTLMMEVIEAATGEPAADFIEQAAQNQKEELDRYRYDL
jgi:hypothetical protein